MADPTQIAAAIYIGILVGVAARTLLPYFNKHAAVVARGGSLTWDWKYIATAIGVVVASLPTAQEVLATYVAPATENLALAFIAAFVYAFGLNHLVNEAVDKGK